jgi:hypothetical protein
MGSGGRSGFTFLPGKLTLVKAFDAISISSGSKESINQGPKRSLKTHTFTGICKHAIRKLL